MIFTKQEMRSVLKGKLGKILIDLVIEKNDWSEMHELVFKIGTHYYQTCYSEGLFEKPFEWEDNIDATEVSLDAIGKIV